MDKYFWTEHSKFKMKQYGLSEQRIKRVLRNPHRKEEGIVKNTIAMMQPVSTKKVDGKEVWKQEIWVMIQKEKGSKQKTNPSSIPAYRQAGSILGRGGGTLKIISAWRYPGVSPKNSPIPEEIIRELESVL